MKKIFLPLFAVLAMASCTTTVDGGDGTDANDSMENAMQGAGDQMQQGASDMADTTGAMMDRTGDRIENAADRAGNNMEAAGEKMDGDTMMRR